MLRISIDRLIRLVESKRRNQAEHGRKSKGYKRLTIGEIADGSGVHRNIVSRILNNPDDPVSTMHIDKLIQYFFYELRRYDEYKKGPEEKDKRIKEKEQIQRLVGWAIDIFPEHEEHKDFIESLEQEPEDIRPDEGFLMEGATMNVPTLWHLYLKNLRPEITRKPPEHVKRKPRATKGGKK